MFRIVKKEPLNPSVTRMSIEAPLVAKKVQQAVQGAGSQMLQLLTRSVQHHALERCNLTFDKDSHSNLLCIVPIIGDYIIY